MSQQSPPSRFAAVAKLIGDPREELFLAESAGGVASCIRYRPPLRSKTNMALNRLDAAARRLQAARLARNPVEYGEAN
jgi:hypothetical protein